MGGRKGRTMEERRGGRKIFGKSTRGREKGKSTI